MAKRPTTIAMKDEKLAQETLQALAMKHRRSIGYLIMAAHNLGVSYHRSYYIEKMDCIFNPHSKLYSVKVPKVGVKNTYIKVVPGVEPSSLWPLFKWHEYQKKPDITDVCRFIAALCEKAGLAIDDSSRLVVGFFEDAPILKEVVKQGSIESES